MRTVLDRYIVRKIDVPQKIGSIILADSAGMNYFMGEVVAAGPGVQEGGVDTVPAAEEGDTVAWLKTQGVEVSIDGAQFTVIREQDILFIK